MPGHGEKLDQKQELAIAALLTEPSQAAAAHKAGIDPSTLKRWLRQPDFRAAFCAARQEIISETVSRLLAACTEAVETLRSNLKCGNSQAENRAAVAILGHAFEGVSGLDLEARITTLEQMQVPDHEKPPEQVEVGEKPGENGSPGPGDSEG